MKQRLCFILCSCLLFFSTLNKSALAQTLTFRNYTVSHGLANSTVYSIYQDSKGFLWFATEGGVNRFDGKTFQLFTVDSGLSDNEVLYIKEDSRGRIWFLTLNGKLSYYFNNTFFNPDNSDLLKKATCKGSFVSLYEDTSNHLWFSTNQDLVLEIDGDMVRFHKGKPNSLANSVISENRKKEIIAVSKDYIQVQKNGLFVRRKITPLPLSSKVVSACDKANSLRFISDGGLYQYRDDKLNLQQLIPQIVLKASPGRFISDNQKKLWIGTMGDGVFLLDPATKKQENHLKGNFITDIIQDFQGNIWISSMGNGVYMLPFYARHTINFTVADGLNSNFVHSILKVNDKLILGLRNGTADIIKGKTIVHRDLKSTDNFNPVKKLYFDKDTKSLWFASDKTFGSFPLEGTGSSILKDAANSSYAVKSFSLSSKGEIALAAASGVYLLGNKMSPQLFSSNLSFKQSLHFLNRAYAVFFDSGNNLWFSNLNGLQVFSNGRLSTLYSLVPDLKKRITDIAELPDKTVICSTHGFGLFVLKKQRLVNIITTRDGLASNICKKIFVDGNDAWIVTSKGISKIEFHKGNKISSYGTSHGMISPEVNDVYVYKDTVYSATNNGLSIFSAVKQRQKEPSPRLYLNSFNANKQTIKRHKGIHLSHLRNTITLNYIALDFAHPSAISYSYRLNPDLKWSETNNTTIEFAALEPGTYHFQLRAKSLNSDWSKPTELIFTIDHPFWETWWFITIAFCVSIALIFLSINKYYRSKRAKERDELIARTRIISLEQQALQAMMNPHFVFNVMNSIQYFINMKDNTMANQVLTGFARLIRKNLENCNKSYISIQEEIDYLNLYLSLEKLRFGERMNYSIEIDQDINREETYIPSMLLQPYVENAIWHGLMPKDAEGTIRIQIRKESEVILKIEITDDGIGIDNSLKSRNTDHISRGMELTAERINLLSRFAEQPITIEISQIQPEGTHVLIRMPLNNRLLS